MTGTLLSPAPAATGAREKRGFSLPRASIDQILDYSRHLSLADRALVEGVYLRGMSVTDLARAARLEPGTIRKRLKRIIMRTSSPLFRYVVRHKQEWPQDRVAIAEAVILRGLSQRAAARSLGASVHRIRREIDRIRAMADVQLPSRASI